MIYDLEQLKLFWEVIKPLNEDGFVEIRLTPTFNTSTEFWSNCKTLASELPSTPVNKLVCFFIKSYDELEHIIKFNSGYFNINSKICYGLNLRYKKGDLLNGSYECLRDVRLIGLDVESVVHEALEGFAKNLFEDYVKFVVKFMERYNLFKPTIVSSGAGVHLLYLIKPVNITEGRKMWFKEWIEEINLLTKNRLFIVDGLKDFTRVFGLAGSFNVKRDKPIIIQSLSTHINNFKFKSKKQPKIKVVEFDDGVLPDVKNSLEFQVLLRQPPKGDRHNTLVFALKLLLKVKGVDYKSFEAVLRKVYGNSLILNPMSGTTNKTYSKGIIINWAKKNWKWLEKYPDLVELYKTYILQ